MTNKKNKTPEKGDEATQRKVSLSAHDRYLRAILANPKAAQDFFETNLPVSIREAVDLSTLKLEKDSFINEQLKVQVADLLYSVTINNEPGYIFLLTEHASTPDRLLSFRLLKYMVAIMDEHMKKLGNKTLPVVYPLVIYSGKRPFKHSLDLFDLFGKNRALARDIYKNPYQLIDLTRLSDQELERYHWFRVAALFLKHIHDKDILPFIREVMGLLRDLENHGEIEYIELSMIYAMRAGEVPDMRDFVDMFVQGLEYIDEDKVMTVIEQLIKERKDKWIAEAEQMAERKAEEKALLIAKNMMADNIPLESIEKFTGISMEVLNRFKH